ncbi:tetratricopeptide repeat protein [Herbaspirillum sp. RV1423]|uniref:tetratricopeptide repeat protein n=1 Tax=Herbaspirillum sp. RV1423 TaxID=1443993 RepID=UPI0004AE9594|nr:tetratricopeptide repeat protein [Herbaspirillum sp. RV1423]
MRTGDDNHDAMSAHSAAKGMHILEQPQPFRDSMLWELQRRYFSERGARAWRDEEVPHYITSNPTIASAYAETVFVFLQERQRRAPFAGGLDEPLTICELGAGSGRFAFHFLRRLVELCSASGVAPTAFRYVLTDFTQSNLDAWRAHSRFQAWFADGLLETALFDVNRSDELFLQVGGARLGRGALQQPLVVLANYVFDGVPQDLYYFEDHVAHDCLVALMADGEAHDVSPEADAAGLLEHLRLEYSFRQLTAAPYDDPVLQQLFAHYGKTVEHGHLLFPASSLQALERLRALSRSGLFLLSADKGHYLPEEMVQAAPPALSRHGSFSLSVNYHALLQWGKHHGGVALQPQYRHRSLAIIGVLLADDAHLYEATGRAYAHLLAGFGPDDFYTLVSFMRRHLAKMEINDILAYLRFGQDDAHQLFRVIPRLKELAPTLDDRHVEEVRALVDRSWDSYFPLGEENDLAFEIGCLLYELDDFDGALSYFERTEQLYGANPGVWYNMAACLQQLGQDRPAQTLLENVLRVMPDNEGARALLDRLHAR